MNIKKENGKIIFEFPESSPRSNPYMEDDQQHLLGNYPFFTGLVVYHRKDGSHYDEIGFAHTIDMDYKGKDDQVSDIVVARDGDEKEFLEKCKELELNVQFMEL